jgi:hypothetical protein
VPLATEFDEIQGAFAQGGPVAVVDFLVAELRRQSRFHELYESLKMQARLRLGLPITPTSEVMPEATQQALEDALVNACREVGGLLIGQGQIRDGWVYFRPVGDREAAAKLLKAIPVSHDNVDDLVQVLLSEGVDPKRGFDLALQFFGTCQSITLFDQEIARHPKSVQQYAAARLVAKVHEDLLSSIQADIQRQVAEAPQSPTISGLINDRDWLFENNAYHIDTTHLAAVVRFAKVIDDPASLELALDLTAYGAKLAPQFHYASEEPFGSLYADHATFFRTLLDRDINDGLSHFRQKAESLDVQEFGSAPIEVYVDLLARMGRAKQALQEAVRLFPPGARSIGIAPTLLELAKAAGDFTPMLDYCQSRGDLLGFAAGLIEKSGRK